MKEKVAELLIDVPPAAEAWEDVPLPAAMRRRRNRRARRRARQILLAGRLAGTDAYRLEEEIWE